MTYAIIKYFTLILCSFYSYNKLLNIKKPKINYIIYTVIASLTFSVLICALRTNFSYFSLLAMILLSFVFITILTKTQIELSITTTIISFGISYAFYTLANILMSIILSQTKLLKLPSSLLTVTVLLQSFIQIILITVPFKLKRLKSGMPFLINKGASNAGVLLSVIILCSVVILSNSKTNLIYLIPIVLVVICAVLVLLWWRNKITQTYVEHLKAAELQNLHNTIEENEKRINYLEQQNDVLSKIIHKDNKLIPAMELAVKEYLNNPSPDEAYGENLLKEIAEISEERCGIIEKYKNCGKKLPITNVFSIDTMLNYMLNKSASDNIEFDVGLSGSVKFMVDNIISETELDTLLADLIENAVIATKNQAVKKILVNIGIVNNCYFIEVIDSGIPFEIRTFNNLGIEKATTHQNDGGSGIGMLTTFDLLKKKDASLIIKEFGDSDKLHFTKKISIIFDKKHQFIIDSYRCEDIKSNCTRNDIVFTENKE